MMGNNACVLFVLRINMSGFYRMAVVGTILMGSGLGYVFISNLRMKQLPRDTCRPGSKTLSLSQLAPLLTLQVYKQVSSKLNAGGNPAIGQASHPDRRRNTPSHFMLAAETEDKCQPDGWATCLICRLDPSFIDSIIQKSMLPHELITWLTSLFSFGCLWLLADHHVSSQEI